MSKKIEAIISCVNCSEKIKAKLFRSVWIEHAENRDLIFSDQINAVTCPKCKKTFRVEFPFLCTNVKKGFAAWYEPYPDAQIDKDAEEYSRHFGADSFYANAPRINDWNKFKQTIIELEKFKEAVGELEKDRPPTTKPSPALRACMDGFIRHLKDTNRSKVSRKRVLWVISSLLALTVFVGAGYFVGKQSPLKKTTNNHLISAQRNIRFAGIPDFLRHKWEFLLKSDELGRFHETPGRLLVGHVDGAALVTTKLEVKDSTDFETLDGIKETIQTDIRRDDGGYITIFHLIDAKGDLVLEPGPEYWTIAVRFNKSDPYKVYVGTTQHEEWERYQQDMQWIERVKSLEERHYQSTIKEIVEIAYLE